MRCIFGNEAFYMFTLQKILSSTSKAINSITQDALSKDILKFYKEQLRKSRPKQWNEELVYAKVNFITE